MQLRAYCAERLPGVLEYRVALPQVRVVGETGLDYYWDDAPPSLQQEWFRAHIEIAKQAGKPLMIHDRDAHDDILRILDADGPPERVVFHCFSGDADMAKRCAAAPAELILAETDSPYLTPMPYRGRPNTPAMAAHTVRCLAEVKQISVADMCALITANGERMFGSW